MLDSDKKATSLKENLFPKPLRDSKLKTPNFGESIEFKRNSNHSRLVIQDASF